MTLPFLLFHPVPKTKEVKKARHTFLVWAPPPSFVSSWTSQRTPPSPPHRLDLSRIPSLRTPRRVRDPQETSTGRPVGAVAPPPLSFSRFCGHGGPTMTTRTIFSPMMSHTFSSTTRTAEAQDTERPIPHDKHYTTHKKTAVRANNRLARSLRGERLDDGDRGRREKANVVDSMRVHPPAAGTKEKEKKKKVVAWMVVVGKKKWKKILRAYRKAAEKPRSIFVSRQTRHAAPILFS